MPEVPPPLLPPADTSRGAGPRSLTARRRRTRARGTRPRWPRGRSRMVAPSGRPTMPSPRSVAVRRAAARAQGRVRRRGRGGESPSAMKVGGGTVAPLRPADEKFEGGGTSPFSNGNSDGGVNRRTQTLAATSRWWRDRLPRAKTRTRTWAAAETQGTSSPSSRRWSDRVCACALLLNMKRK